MTRFSRAYKVLARSLHQRTRHLTNELWLPGNIGNILDRECHVQETIRNLQNELNVYKRAYADVDNERQQLAAQKQEAERQRGELELQLKVS